MARGDDVAPDVNRLYWETDEPVTRLAEQIGVSRGTFYNHLRPLPARATCSACGGRLLFRNRSSRDARQAHCGECGADEQLDSAATGAPRPAGRAARPEAASSASGEGRGRGGRLAATTARGGDEAQTTELLLVAVGAAVVGLAMLMFSRRR